MKKIFIASKNKGKINEIKSFLNPFGYEIFSLHDVHGIDDIPETGSTFEENALIKAKAVYDAVKIPVLSDDSGLMVDYLKNKPGVYSARYAGDNSSDEKNTGLLLQNLNGVTENNRKAHFKCVIVLFDGVNERFFEGVCNGRISFEPKGNNGFGYDPVFIPDGYDKTFAELPSEIKNKISHRGLALRSLIKFIELENSM